MADLTDAELDALEAAARAATPGPWRVVAGTGDYWGEPVWDVRTVAERATAFGVVADHVVECAEERKPDAEYIAQANPATMLALAAEVRRLRAALGAERPCAAAQAPDEAPVGVWCPIDGRPCDCGQPVGSECKTRRRSP